MERESSPPQVTIRPRSRLPVVMVVLLILLQLVSPHRAWIILLCGVGGMALAAYLWARSLAQSARVIRSLRYVWA
jgi:hypothetical protein